MLGGEVCWVAGSVGALGVARNFVSAYKACLPP